MSCPACARGETEDCQHLALCGVDCCGPWDDEEDDE